MLDDAQRVARYQTQTGRTKLTDRQQRRVNRKRRHQQAQAERRLNATLAAAS